MPQKTTECKVFKVEMLCDQCEKGMMEPTGEVYMTAPPQYVHKCSICGHKSAYREKYPYMETKPVCGEYAKPAGNVKAEKTGKLTICCLSDNAERLERMRAILMYRERVNITGVQADQFCTMDAVYRFINCEKPEHVKGVLADQVIIDFREPMRSMAKEMVRMSCVPEPFRVIDDRKIGV